MKKHQVLLLLFSILNVATLKAKVEIASIFNDNMVLQQQMDVNIWGTASPNKKVTIQPTWTSTVFSTTSDKNGKWKTKISTPEAGGPYHIKISDGKGTQQYPDRRSVALFRTVEHGDAHKGV